MKKLVKKIIRWAFKEEIDNFISEYASVSVDVHHKSRSWAVINLEGKNGSVYLKFIDLGHSDLITIQRFLEQFQRPAIDASPLDFDKTMKRFY